MRIRESLLAEIWSRQLIEKDALLTVEGERVQVLYPGRMNDDRGPDFCDALIAVGGRTPLMGEVELHVSSHEWRSHGHHRDPGYNGVILHVVMWNDKDKSTILHSGKRIPILALYPYLNGSLEELNRAVQLPTPAHEPCHRILKRYDEAATAELLDRVGEERFYSKVDQFRKRLNAKAASQVLYEGVMRALGYAKNKEPFEELARMLPLDVLSSFARKGDIHMLQALMLGTAGLLPNQRNKKNRECHSSGWGEFEVGKLEQTWESFGTVGRIRKLNWHFFRVRPENLPTRRIAGASYLLSRYGGERTLGDILNMLSRVPMRQAQKDLERCLMVTGDGYWSNHYDFGFKSRGNPSLIGRGRAREIVVNVLLPFAFAWAEEIPQPYLRERAIELYRGYPRLGKNRITRYMERQIFGEYQAKLLNSACREQGLIHLYNDYCVERRCPECPLARGSTPGHSQKTSTGYFFNAKAMEETAQGVQLFFIPGDLHDN